MTKEEIKLIITDNKLEDAVNEIFKILSNVPVSSSKNHEGWISVFENPPKYADSSEFTDGEFLCVNDWGWMMVASISKTGIDKYTGYQKNGSCLSNVTHYMKLPTKPSEG